jgi:uncharacterized membrane protein
MITILVLTTTITSGLIAGVFFAFSTFIMKALKRLAPSKGIVAMQNINQAVFNPWFMITFIGTAVISLFLILFVLFLETIQTGWIILGSLFYFVGVFLVTGLYNVPLNEKLANAHHSDPKSRELWSFYLVKWTRWNHVRTIAGIGAMLFFVGYLVR